MYDPERRALPEIRCQYSGVNGIMDLRRAVHLEHYDANSVIGILLETWDRSDLPYPSIKPWVSGSGVWTS